MLGQVSNTCCAKVKDSLFIDILHCTRLCIGQLKGLLLLLIDYLANENAFFFLRIIIFLLLFCNTEIKYQTRTTPSTENRRLNQIAGKVN